MNEIKLRDKVKKHKEWLLENKRSDINNAKGNALMFKAVKMLNRKQYENPPIHDNKGKSITNKQEIHNVIKEYLSNHFFLIKNNNNTKNEWLPNRTWNNTWWNH